MPHKTLPPDPDEKNDERASWAAAAISRFRRATGSDKQDALCDLFADLMHWCDRNDMDFRHELGRGRAHYDAETVAETTDAQPDHPRVMTLAEAANGIPAEREDIAEALGAVKATQNAFWEAMKSLESLVPGLELDGTSDYANMTVTDVLAEVDQDHEDEE